jgi:zinc protease
MKEISAALTLALICGCGPSAPTSDEAEPTPSEQEMSRTFDMPYLTRDLDNGLRVIVVRTDYPDIVTLQIPVQTGSRNEVEPGKSGFAHFFEHMMFRGTKKFPTDLYTDILKKAGAAQNAYTSDDYTNYHTTFTKADLEKMIEVEADRFQNLEYSESAFRTEALAVKGEYLKNYSNPTAKAYERIRDLAFNRHSYQHTTMGFIEDIEAMPEQMQYSREFFNRWYRPEKTAVIIVGDVDPEQTFELVRKYWANWEKGDYTVDIPVEPPLGGPIYEHIEWEGPTQPWLFMAFRGPALDPTGKDMPAMDLLSSVYFSESSSLYQKLVLEDQSVDQLMTYFPNRKDPNLLMLYARLTDEKHAAEVEAAINNTLAEARTGLIDNKRLEDTKSRLRYLFTAELDSAGGIGSVLASFVQFARTPETINEVYRSYGALTSRDMRDAANRYFVDAGRVTVTLSSGASMAGIDGKSSVDIIAAKADGSNSGIFASADESAEGVGNPAPEGATAAASGSPTGSLAETPVSIVAQPSASAPLVDVAFVIHAGAAMDPPNRKGLASLTAAMITEGGSTTHTIQQINDAMYALASGFDAQVDKEMTRLSGQVHKDNLDTWYGLIRGQVLSPGWREQDFRRVKTQLVNSIRTSLVGNNDEELGKEVLYSEIYGREHPYGSLNLGHIGDIEATTLADVKKFYEDYYTINNVTVGLAGGYDDAFPARLAGDLQNLRAGTRVRPEIPSAPPLGANKAVIVEKETPAVAVSLGIPVELRRGDPDWVALWLARSYLGEHRSTNAHLFQRIREERGMNYGDYAYIEYFPRGMFQFHPDANLARQQQIFQIWIRPVRNNNDAHFATRTAIFELRKLIDEGMSESNFEATRSFLSKFVSLLTDGQSRQLGYEIDGQYYGTGRFSDYVRAGLARLTLEDVNRVIRENLTTDNLQYVFVAKDAADLRQRLVDGSSSAVSYDSAKPDELLEEDREIASLPLGFAEDAVRIVPSSEVFGGAGS